MNKIKKVALKKMENEMTEKTPLSERIVYEWLCKQKDIELYQGVLNPLKSLKNAYQYAYSQAKPLQVGGCAIIDEQLVYLWIANYFKQPTAVATDTLTKEGAPKPKPKSTVSKETNKPKKINKVKSKKKETVKKETSKKKMMEGEQLSLLDFL